MTTTQSPNHRARGRRTVLAVVIATLVALVPVAAFAHPLGNFTVNRFSHVMLHPNHVDLTVIIDLAEVPTYQVLPLIDLNRDEVVDETERTSYIAAEQERLTPLFALSVEGMSVPLEAGRATLEFPPGQADLPTTRLTLTYSADLSAGENSSVTFRNDAYADRLGWQEIVVSATEGVSLANSSAPTESISNELRSYPETLLQEPLAMREVTFQVQAGSSSNAVGDVSTVVPETAPAGFFLSPDRFAELITRPLDTPWGVAIAVGLALLLGGGARPYAGAWQNDCWSVPGRIAWHR